MHSSSYFIHFVSYVPLRKKSIPFLIFVGSISSITFKYSEFCHNSRILCVREVTVQEIFSFHGVQMFLNKEVATCAPFPVDQGLGNVRTQLLYADATWSCDVHVDSITALGLGDNQSPESLQSITRCEERPDHVLHTHFPHPTSGPDNLCLPA